MQLAQQIQHAAGLIASARGVVAMTGAGISTPSGIPDFRSPDSGLWDQADPLEVASIFAFRHNPQRFYNWVRPLALSLLEARPNPAHYALAALEQEGKLKAIITQNIDNLHSKASSKTVYELHGHLRTVTCTRCFAVEDSAAAFAKFMRDGQVPRHTCGGVLKPNVILFGEPLPIRELVLAQEAIKEADLLLIAGSSLEVAPASDLPQLALENKAKLIIINYQPTYLDARAAVVIRADVAEALPRIVELVKV
ncbi:MAG: RNA polymerase subunit sigma [Anaerolineae bacterium]|nr:NAD-dependent deacylase [Anaerolineales bacterium]MCQ3978243.1 RNA polymerase subunit sigma [Anaerolineae bacterium]